MKLVGTSNGGGCSRNCGNIQARRNQSADGLHEASVRRLPLWVFRRIIGNCAMSVNALVLHVNILLPVQESLKPACAADSS
jgi:hypothetical protein